MKTIIMATPMNSLNRDMKNKNFLENKINPTPSRRCPKCGGRIMNVFGVDLCQSCDYKKDLYSNNKKQSL